MCFQEVVGQNILPLGPLFIFHNFIIDTVSALILIMTGQYLQAGVAAEGAFHLPAIDLVLAPIHDAVGLGAA
jgi:hypothetical protein